MTSPETASLEKPPQTRVGIEIEPRFVKRDEDPYSQVKWAKRESAVKGAEGEDIFSMKDLEAPEEWSQLAVDIAASKYLRRSGVPGVGRETSIRQLVHRVARTIRTAGENLGGYFRTPADATNFEKELVHILLQQKGAFNSPVWFNCGLFHEYGIHGSGGGYFWNHSEERVEPTKTAFKNPQCSACFIQSVDDDLMSIYDLLKHEARLFKYGSGSGTNFSNLRSRFERLSGGGYSSGLMSFLEVLDRSAGATKSGGTTRRAAKMVCLDMDHPEIEDFITWKMREEKKVQALVSAGFSSDFNGEAYKTVAGQNSNNSIRLSDEFMRAVEDDGDWETISRTSGEVLKTYRARDLWRKIAESSWTCADPGLQFHTVINSWHTCSASGEITASNPCSEYMFLNDSACNLSSINLTKFLNADGTFDVPGFKHCVRVLILAQDILVDFSSYPTELIARNSHDFRPLGLGYANLGTLLMVKGLPYDSEAARSLAATITSLMSGEAYRVSAELAREKGEFSGFRSNQAAMLKVIERHRDTAYAMKAEIGDKNLQTAALGSWDQALAAGRAHGYRNAQVSVLAPTGTIGFLMDCDTTGVEPDFALVKFKKLAGGGYMKIVNQSVPRALSALGYSRDAVSNIVRYAIGTLTLDCAAPVNREVLLERGLDERDIQAIEQALPTAFDLQAAVSPWVLGEKTLRRLNIDRGSLKDASVLEALAFSRQEIERASLIICGHMTVENSPDLKPEHLPVFDCANRCGTVGTRYIAPLGHLQMMSAVQPFLSGAISKTVNLPNEVTVEEIEDLHFQAWKLNLKAVAVYRDGCKLSQPLNGKTGTAKKAEITYTQAELDEAILKALEIAPGRRRKMPYKRDGMTIEARVCGHQVYVRTGEFEDGKLGEIFIDMHKEGATFRSLLNCFAISISLGLQYGVPLEQFVEKFVFTRFEPAGFVDHPHIKQATSVLDYIFRLLAFEYLGKTDLVHVKPEQMTLPLEKAALPESIVSAADEPIMSAQVSRFMADAPICNECGHVTIRNGTCYRCLNCGSSMGCS
ncbi:MAG TPA: vitamin B12-dependent ribonucleotide reductase [Bdellovibrionales bacterium]|nr:vitamin B12-dependent ribonucleotide reductase [Bdellovibrionales bacterium]